jgi:hypothetical protein
MSNEEEEVFKIVNNKSYNYKTENYIFNHRQALKELEEGKGIIFLCKHHAYKIIDGKIKCLNEEVEKESPFNGFSKEEMESDWRVIDD